MSFLINFFTVVILVFSIKLQNVVANPTNNFPNSNVELRIVGGKEAKDAQFPYAAGVISQNEQGNKQLCGGSLISTTSVLTAGHCLFGKTSAKVTLGVRNLTEGAVEPKKQMFECNNTNFIIHPNFDASRMPNINDLAIIKLNHPAILDTHVKIIHIPADDKSAYDGKAGTAMGWGRTCNDAKKASLHSLLYESNTIITNAGCQKTNPYIKNRLLDTHMCQSGKGLKRICHGDSGGPLVVNKDLLVGVLSFGNQDCEHEHACVATRLSKYIKWINDNAF